MTGARPEQITAGHRQRLAIVYLRQSTPRQVEENTGSTAHQRDQAEYARQWGWPEDGIEIIDEDLGLSGASVKGRTGWQRVLQLVTNATAGIIFVSDVSRLNRSSHDFHLLAELCRQMGVLLAVDGRIVDFNDPTDSFMATIRAAVAQYDNALRAKTFQAAARAKARRGHAVRQPPTGYEEAEKGQWVKDRDQAVRDAIDRIFQDYLRLGTLGKLLRVHHEHGLVLPIRWGGTLRWVEPYRTQLHRILTNPAYRGDYVYGRRVTVRGKTTRQGNSEQIIVVPGHHEPYVTPEVWAQIQAQLAHNQLTVRRPAGHGSALCQGLLRCGRCGLMMCVQYYPRQDRMGCSYLCIQGRRYFGRPPCWAVNGRVLDEVVAADLLQSLRPPELEAVIHAAQEVNAAYEAVVRQRQAEVEQAQYEVDLAWRRYQNVDPANRRTARALECDHEQKQAALEALERRHAESRTVPPLAATPEVVAAIHTGARDLPALWAAPSTTHQDRKTLLRLFVREIRLTECTAMTFDIEIRWVGGATTRHTIAHPTAFSRLAERLQAQGCTEEQIVEEARCRALRTGRQGRSYDLNDVRATLRRRARKGQQRTRPPWKTHCESLRPLLSELAGSGLCDRAVAEEFNRRRIDGYFPGKPWDEQKVLVVRRALGIACGRASYTAQHPLRDLLRKLVAKKRSDGEIAAEFNRQGCQGFTISLPWTAGKISDLRHRLGILQRRARRRRRATPAAVHTEAA